MAAAIMHFTLCSAVCRDAAVAKGVAIMRRKRARCVDARQFACSPLHRFTLRTRLGMALATTGSITTTTRRLASHPKTRFVAPASRRIDTRHQDVDRYVGAVPGRHLERGRRVAALVPLPA